LSRDEYLRHVLRLYLEAPDTPNRARSSDWAVASTFYQRGIGLEDLRHAIRLVSLRRRRRAPDLPPLEPIASLAYFRPTLEHLQHQPPDPGYVEYVHLHYQELLGERIKRAAQRQKTAVLRRR
jgi:hypothetical protein